MRLPGAPSQQKIYHITHIQNLPTMVGREILSDAMIRTQGGFDTKIGMSSIKQRRLILPVSTHRGTFVGDYVPFYFCPRSLMLYILYRGNHADLTYREGQGPIVHLEADLSRTVEWAHANGRKWALSLSNAGAGYAEFRSNVAGLYELDWGAIQSTDFRDPLVKEGKQAELLVHTSFPWQLVERIGVQSLDCANAVRNVVGQGGPSIQVRRDWYY